MARMLRQMHLVLDRRATPNSEVRAERCEVIREARSDGKSACSSSPLAYYQPWQDRKYAENRLQDRSQKAMESAIILSRKLYDIFFPVPTMCRACISNDHWFIQERIFFPSRVGRSKAGQLVVVGKDSLDVGYHVGVPLQKSVSLSMNLVGMTCLKDLPRSLNEVTSIIWGYISCSWPTRCKDWGLNGRTIRFEQEGVATFDSYRQWWVSFWLWYTKIITTASLRELFARLGLKWIWWRLGMCFGTSVRRRFWVCQLGNRGRFISRKTSMTRTLSVSQTATDDLVTHSCTMCHDNPTSGGARGRENDLCECMVSLRETSNLHL